MEADDRVLYQLITDRSGSTPKVSLEAPSAQATTRPGAKTPSYYYSVTTTSEGFYPVENIGVEIYEGITTIQGVRMIPRAAGSEVSPPLNETIFNEAQRPEL